MHFVWYQTPAHPELSTPAGDARAVRYNVGGFWPTAYFDGFYRSPQISDSFYEVYSGMADLARSQKSILELSLDSAAVRLDSTELRIGVHITPTDSVLDDVGSLMLVAVVYEDSVAYPSMLGDTAYARFCARRVIGDTWGIPLTLRFGTDYDTVLTTTPDPAWKLLRLGVAVFVQDTSSLRVMQSVGKFRLGN